MHGNISKAFEASMMFCIWLHILYFLISQVTLKDRTSTLRVPTSSFSISQGDLDTVFYLLPVIPVRALCTPSQSVFNALAVYCCKNGDMDLHCYVFTAGGGHHSIGVICTH